MYRDQNRRRWVPCRKMPLRGWDFGSKGAGRHGLRCWRRGLFRYGHVAVFARGCGRGVLLARRRCRCWMSRCVGQGWCGMVRSSSLGGFPGIRDRLARRYLGLHLLGLFLLLLLLLRRLWRLAGLRRRRQDRQSPLGEDDNAVISRTRTAISMVLVEMTGQLLPLHKMRSRSHLSVEACRVKSGICSAWELVSIDYQAVVGLRTDARIWKTAMLLQRTMAEILVWRIWCLGLMRMGPGIDETLGPTVSARSPVPSSARAGSFGLEGGDLMLAIPQVGLLAGF